MKLEKGQDYVFKYKTLDTNEIFQGKYTGSGYGPRKNGHHFHNEKTGQNAYVSDVDIISIVKGKNYSLKGK